MIIGKYAMLPWIINSVIGSMEEIRPLFAVDQVEIQMDIERNPLKEINIHSSDHDLPQNLVIRVCLIESNHHQMEFISTSCVSMTRKMIGLFHFMLKIKIKKQKKKKIKLKSQQRNLLQLIFYLNIPNQYENHYPIINQYTSLDSCFDYLLSIESSLSAISALIAGLAIVMIWVVFIIKS
ncbi:hypothetical protein PSHT_03805 [Puccinia striiformis]|uniref:Uncharacterized protein n=1 Tax=Puccinia striiformis TaxID=27350 RepID=A0A2S4WEF8_9BASI|nr:hypothetical protein PSHT_03805 [Puccinia striiformis]